MILLEVNLDREWEEWYYKITTPWFTADPHPGKEWIIEQFKKFDCYEAVKKVYTLHNIRVLGKEKFLNLIKEITFYDFLKEKYN